MPRPAKRAKLLSDASGSSSDSDGAGQSGVRLPAPNPAVNGFTVNEEYAKRFEHNKKREEKHRLEEKFGGANGKRSRAGEEGDEDGASSTDESEDDDAELATADLDGEILDTLQAIKNKDPRVYDAKVKFYRDFDADATANGVAKKEKPMYLQDYHRQNLLAGHAGGEDADGDEEEAPPQTYQQEQDAMKRELVGSMHATTNGAAEEEEAESDEGDFLVAKSKPKHDTIPTAPKPKHITDHDVAAADKDPETYLSNFMAARAWLPTDGSRFQPLDSDDSEEERKADEFEDAYNMRFEDPKKANEKLQSFARDVGKFGVRREEKGGRARAREREKEQKGAEKREREEDRARLRKLKVDEAEEKVNRIREAAGLRGKDVDLEQWRDIIEGDFDDDQWDQEMKRRFGEKYYAEDEGGVDSDVEMAEVDGKKSKKNKVKKPKWDDDIDIKDLAPDFEDEDTKPDITLSSDDEADGGAPLPASDSEADEGEEEEEEAQHATKKRKTKKDRLQEKADAKRAARKQRMKIEEMVDATLPLSTHPALAPSGASSSSSRAPAGFRYRDTSPTSFGLSARDILFADDSQLNQFAGLKKMATWRDEEKKRREKKKFSKKARLRQWRKETFGRAEEPEGGFERVLGFGDGAGDGRGGVGGGEAGGVKEGERRKKRRSRKRKVGEAETEA